MGASTCSSWSPTVALRNLEEDSAGRGNTSVCGSVCLVITAVSYPMQSLVLFQHNILLLLWEFHFIHTNHTHFPHPSMPLHLNPLPLWASPHPKGKVQCVASIVTGACPLNRIEPSPQLRKPAIVEHFVSASLSQVLRVLLLSRLLPFGGGVGMLWSQMPSMFIFLKCTSSVVNIFAKVASQSFTISRSTDCGLPHAFWWHYRPQTWSWPQ